MLEETIVIVGLARTPMGGLLGEISTVPAPVLGGIAIKGALDSAGLDGECVDETIMGCVLPAGQGQAPARQASKVAGIPYSAGAVTLNKMCGSGMKAMMLAHDSIIAGSNDIVVAGGMESMSLAPHLLPSGRTGTKYGHGRILDHMALDGLTDAFDGGTMGEFAELCAEEYQFTREAQDAYATESLERAQRAIEQGDFEDEIVPVMVKSHEGEIEIRVDEQPLKARPERIPTLKPAFKKNGTVTAANSSSISDGAAAVVMMKTSEAEKRGLRPIAIIRAQATHAQEPRWFTTAPVDAIDKVMAKAGWSMGDVDLFEINEAFAVVPMAAIKSLGLDPAKVNVNGGACALGHPIGASGARICVTLLQALQKRGLTKGIASLCIGGGEATAIALEILG